MKPGKICLFNWLVCVICAHAQTANIHIIGYSIRILRERLKLLVAPTPNTRLHKLTNECYSLETLPLCTIDLHKQPAVTISCTSTFLFFVAVVVVHYFSFHFLPPILFLGKVSQIKWLLFTLTTVQCSMFNVQCVRVRSELVHAVRSGATCDICKMVYACMNGKISHPKGKLTENEPSVDVIVHWLYCEWIYYLMCASMRTRCKTKPLSIQLVNFVFPLTRIFAFGFLPHPIKSLC